MLFDRFGSTVAAKAKYEISLLYFIMSWLCDLYLTSIIKKLRDPEIGWIHIFEVLNIQVNRLFTGESNASNIFILLVDVGALTCCIGFCDEMIDRSNTC